MKIPYRVVRTQRKTVALTFDKEGELVVRSPKKLSSKAIEQFVQANTAWISTYQPALKQRWNQQKTFDFSDGMLLPWQGKELPIRTSKAPQVLPAVIALPAVSAAERKQMYFALLKQTAQQILPARVAFFAPQLEVQPTQIKVTSARTRWGSCNRNGTLCFSRFLMIATPEEIDYVVVHELAHLREHNHSAAFYHIIEEILPAYRQQQQSLRQRKLPFV